MENSINQRIKDIIKSENYSIRAFAKEIGLANTSLTDIVNNNAEPKASTIEKILTAKPYISTEWLIKGSGQMINNNANDTIPLYRAEAAAGFGTPNFSIEEKDIEARYRVREFVDASFMLYVHGKSMEPLYNSGDIIAVKIEKDIENIHWGKVYLISSKEDGLLIKRIYDHGKDIICVSENPTFSPIFVHKSDIKGLASVKGTIRIESL